MEPEEMAEIGLPDGASMMEILSSRSTYISLEVWRTLDFLHGIAGPLLRLDWAFSVAARLLEGPRDGAEL